MHPRLHEIVTYLEEQRASLLAAADRIPRREWMKSPAPGAWSVSEVLEHLRLSEEAVARLVTKLGNEARVSGRIPAETQTSSLLSSLDQLLAGRGVVDRTVRREAPETVRPGGPVAEHVVLEGLSRSRIELLKAIAAVDGLALEHLRWTSAVLGDLHLYQYILFVGQHEARHTMQLEDMAPASSI